MRHTRTHTYTHVHTHTRTHTLSWPLAMSLSQFGGEELEMRKGGSGRWKEREKVGGSLALQEEVTGFGSGGKKISKVVCVCLHAFSGSYLGQCLITKPLFAGIHSK